jgi:hypothetical protein
MNSPESELFRARGELRPALTAAPTRVKSTCVFASEASPVLNLGGTAGVGELHVREIEPGVPGGVKVVPIYDRSELIRRSIDNLKSTLLEITLTVSLIILIFLWHFPSAMIPVITIPIAVLLSFIPFRMLGITANIMSLGGIAIAVGALVDAAHRRASDRRPLHLVCA